MEQKIYIILDTQSTQDIDEMIWGCYTDKQAAIKEVIRVNNSMAGGSNRFVMYESKIEPTE